VRVAGLAAKGRDGVREDGGDRLEAFDRTARRAGEIDDQRPAPHAGHLPRKGRRRKRGSRGRPHRLGEARHFVVERGARGLRRDVARRETRPARRQNEVGGIRVGNPRDLLPDQTSVVRDDRGLNDGRRRDQTRRGRRDGRSPLVGALAAG